MLTEKEKVTLQRAEAYHSKYYEGYPLVTFRLISTNCGRDLTIQVKSYSADNKKFQGYYYGARTVTVKN